MCLAGTAGAAQNAEFCAMRVIEGDVTLGLCECRAKLEFRAVGQQRAGQNRGRFGSLATHIDQTLLAVEGGVGIHQ